MSTQNEIIIRIKEEGTVSVEESYNGVNSYKAILPDSLLECINKSLLRGGVSSGLLPRNCLSFTEHDNGIKDICILHPEDKADITFMETEYKNFPLPRLVFGFTISSEGRISNSRLGVIENTEMLKPDTKMYRWPLSNVGNTRICLGNNPMPKCTSLHTLGSLPYLIIAIPNNLDLFSAANNRPQAEMRELLEMLKDKQQSYYYEHILLPSGATLGDFVTHNRAGM
jgi:hypothetical protein